MARHVRIAHGRLRQQPLIHVPSAATGRPIAAALLLVPLTLSFASYGVLRLAGRVVHTYPCMSLTSQTHRMRWAAGTSSFMQAMYAPAVALEQVAHVGVSAVMNDRYCR